MHHPSMRSVAKRNLQIYKKMEEISRKAEEMRIETRRLCDLKDEAKRKVEVYFSNLFSECDFRPSDDDELETSYCNEELQEIQKILEKQRRINIQNKYELLKDSLRLKSRKVDEPSDLFQAHHHYDPVDNKTYTQWLKETMVKYGKGHHRMDQSSVVKKSELNSYNHEDEEEDTSNDAIETLSSQERDSKPDIINRMSECANDDQASSNSRSRSKTSIESRFVPIGHLDNNHRQSISPKDLSIVNLDDHQQQDIQKESSNQEDNALPLPIRISESESEVSLMRNLEQLKKPTNNFYADDDDINNELDNEDDFWN